ncbi:MAG: M18 family aminopeptidase [Chlamydiota bacterium]|nr:M18 family aminopeptidase [Chlamydiota bacterium]
MSSERCIEDLISFLDGSPTAWHAIDNCKKKLKALDFTELKESERWEISPGGKYYITRNGTSIFAFIAPTSAPTEAIIAAAHTDSPALKIKSNAEYKHENMTMLGTDVYGGPLLSSWLNRDLMITGRVVFSNSNEALETKLIALEEFPVTIPQLAIHLDRGVNEKGPALNKQTHLDALAAVNYEGDSFLMDIIQKEVGSNNILGHDLFLCPIEKAKRLGYNKELLATYRFDNLGSAHAALTGITDSIEPAKNTIKAIVLWDSEEIGSATAQGAESPFFTDCLERITLSYGLDREDYFRLISNSLCLSIDQAHALHPNYPDKHDSQHAPLLGKGIVIKYNAQQKYATDADTEAVVQFICQKENIPFQKFICRGDIPCGSTIGPLHASATGMKTVDLGLPQLSMHSVRELGACDDHISMCHFISVFFNTGLIKFN